jgi:hypothetical protein
LDGELELARRRHALAKFACAYNCEQVNQLALPFFIGALTIRAIECTAYGAPYFSSWRF